MKFATIIAVVGVASAKLTNAELEAQGDARNAKNAKENAINKKEKKWVPTPCDNTMQKYWNAKDQAEQMERNCERVNWVQYVPPATKTGEKQEPRPWDACDTHPMRGWRQTEWKLQGAFDKCQEEEDRKELKERGLDIQKASNHDGEIHASLNWHKIGDSAQQWGRWFEGESQSKEAQEIAMHLNSAAKKMVNSIASGQADVVRNGGHLVNAFTQWAEPGTKCDSDAYVKCIANDKSNDMVWHCDWDDATHTKNCSQVYDPNAEIRPVDVMQSNLMGHCARQSSCAVMKGTRAQEETAEKYAHATQNALAKMAHEVQNDVMGEMRSQKANDMTIAKAWLDEANKRWKAWGCEPKCVDHSTRNFGHLDHIHHCKCPATLTITGDTSIIFQ